MAKVKNISGRDLIVPALGGRLVVAGAVVEVPDDAVYGFTCQGPNWEPADDETQAVHDKAHAAELEALGIEPEQPKKKATPKKENV